MARKRKINALAYGLMGAATGFLSSLLENFKTERAIAAKKLEAEELRKMMKEDRAEASALRQAERVEDRGWRVEDQVADREQRNSELEARREEHQAELGQRASIAAQDRAARAAEVAANRQLQKEQDFTRLANAQIEAANRVPAAGQIVTMPDGSKRQIPFGAPLPAGASPYGTYGVNVEQDPRARGGPLLPGVVKPDLAGDYLRQRSN